MHEGYDAFERTNWFTRKLQLKGGCLQSLSKPGQRLGRIDVRKDWDAILMVLLDANLEAVAMYEADRVAVLEALSAPGSRARNERGALGVNKLKAIGRLRWPPAGRDSA
jgi:hypothetical protein